jgi:hypothetical protein
MGYSLCVSKGVAGFHPEMSGFRVGDFQKNLNDTSDAFFL